MDTPVDKEKDKDDLEVSFDAFKRPEDRAIPDKEKEEDDTEKEEPPAKEEPAKEEEGLKFDEIEEPPKDEPPAKEEQAAQPEGTGDVKSPKGRDYSGLDEASHRFLKATSSASFEFLKPRLLKLQTLEKEVKTKDEELTTLKKQLSEKPSSSLPENYYEHEEAYTLDGEYKQTVSLYSQATEVENHWKEQLRRAKKGEDIQDIVADAQGNMHLVDVPHDVDLEFKVADKLQQIISVRNQLGQKATEIQTSFKENVSKNLAGLKQAEDTLFPSLKDQAKLEQNPDYIKIKKDLESKKLDKTLLSPIFRKFYVHHMDLLRKYNAATDQLKKRGIVSAKVQPATSQIVAGSTESPSKGKSIEDESVKDVADSFEKFIKSRG